MSLRLDTVEGRLDDKKLLVRSECECTKSRSEAIEEATVGVQAVLSITSLTWSFNL